MLVKNCVYCILSPLFFYSKWFASPAYIFQCTHDNEFSTVTYYFSKFYYGFGIFLWVILCIGCYHYIDILTTEYKTVFNAQWIFTLINFIICLRSCFMQVASFRSVIPMRIFLLTLDELIKRHKLKTLQDILPEKEQKRFKSLIIFYMECGFVLFLIDLIIDRSSASVYSKISQLLSLTFALMILTTYVIVSDYCAFAVNYCYEYLQKILENPGQADIDKKISEILRLYIDLIHCFKYCNMVYNLGALIWMTSTVLITILNTFVLIIFIFESLEMSAFIVITYRVYVGYLISIVMLLRIENMEMQNKRMLSFLYKYPSSQLGPEEASQIELILSTFRLCKPSLNALGIFDLGVKLCAACSGTIITYILVLLQFYLPWVNKSQNST